MIPNLRQYLKRTFICALIVCGIFYVLIVYENSIYESPVVNNRNKQDDTKTYLEGENKKSYQNLTPADIEHIKELISEHNASPPILNSNSYSPLRTHSIIFLIQVHLRYKELGYLIESLAKVKDISKVLLIFSHDVYDKKINNLVQSIKFCKVVQIFYEHSIQTHPYTFPGTDPNDCPPKITRKEAIKIRCNNADFPDKYGNYREAAYVQTKHHWWWKANMVFDKLYVTRRHKGFVFFLEEDHYVVEDAVHMLSVMIDYRSLIDERINVISMGNYEKSFKSLNQIAITEWASSTLNMGFGINHDTWTKIKNCSETFCTYDDYNWDWSLQMMAKSCIDDKLTVLLPLFPRIYHIGECGMHHRSKICDPDGNIKAVQIKIKQALQRDSFYPEQLELMDIFVKKPGIKPNGGWGDIRDHNLCLNMSKYSIQ